MHALKKCNEHHMNIKNKVILLGCFGSIATLTIGVASKLRGMNGGQDGEVHSVADFSTKS